MDCRKFSFGKRVAKFHLWNSWAISLIWRLPAHRVITLYDIKLSRPVQKLGYDSSIYAEELRYVKDIRSFQQNASSQGYSWHRRMGARNSSKIQDNQSWEHWPNNILRESTDKFSSSVMRSRWSRDSQEHYKHVRRRHNYQGCKWKHHSKADAAHVNLRLYKQTMSGSLLNTVCKLH